MADLPLVTAFEIRLHKADGAVSITMMVNAFGANDAKLQAAKMLGSDIAYAIVWHDLLPVCTVHRDRAN